MIFQKKLNACLSLKRKNHRKKINLCKRSIDRNLIHRDKTNMLFMSTIKLSQKVDKSKNKIACDFN